MNALPQDQDNGRIVGLVHQQPLQAGKGHIIQRSQHLHTVDNVARKVDTLCYIIKTEPDKYIDNNQKNRTFQNATDTCRLYKYLIKNCWIVELLNCWHLH